MKHFISLSLASVLLLTAAPALARTIPHVQASSSSQPTKVLIRKPDPRSYRATRSSSSSSKAMSSSSRSSAPSADQPDLDTYKTLSTARDYMTSTLTWMRTIDTGAIRSIFGQNDDDAARMDAIRNQYGTFIGTVSVYANRSATNHLRVPELQEALNAMNAGEALRLEFTSIFARIQSALRR